MKGRFSQPIGKGVERFDALSIRERILILVTLITLLFIGWDYTLMSPLGDRQKKMIDEMQSLNKSLETTTAQMIGILKKKKDDRPELQKRIDDAKRSLAHVQKKQADVTDEFVAPDKMVSVLRDMLKADSGLVLKQLKSLGTTPFKKMDELIVHTATDDMNDRNVGQQKATIYKHGLQIVFEGDFFSTLKYLKSLESMPWHFYWDTVDYKVLEFPRARVSIIVHTLSLDAWWIGV